MISRVAESCYWLSRYVERCETTARLLHVQSGMVLDTVLASHRTWRPLLIVSGEAPSFEERFGPDAVGDGERVLEYLTWDDANPASIFSSLRAARENARTIRETISLEMWNSLNAFWLWMCEDQTRALYEGERQEFYEQVSGRCHGFNGVISRTMLFEEPYDFMRLGMYLERAGQTARLLDIHHHALVDPASVPNEALDAVEWIAILRTRYAYEPFFKKARRSLAGPAVAEFLLREESFPGSVSHALTGALAALERIRPDGSPIGRRSGELLNTLRGAVVDLDVGRAVGTTIHDVLTMIVDRAAEVSRTIGEDYFYAVRPEVEKDAEVREA